MKQRIISISSIFIGVAMLVFVFTACQSDGDELPENKQGETVTVQRKMNGEYLVALATYRLFDDKGMSAKSTFQNFEKDIYMSINKSNTDEEYPNIKYEFDFVKINDAIHFVAKNIDFPFLNEICGNGEIEVFLTTFDTFIYGDEAKDKNKLQFFINDGLIVFRHST